MGRSIYLAIFLEKTFSGQDRYGVMTRVYYKDAHAAVIVMDASRERTVEGALRLERDGEKEEKRERERERLQMEGRSRAEAHSS